jgi:hypothetical protein
MTRRRRLVFVVVAGIVAASVAHFADPTGTTSALILLASGLVIGELLVLRLENGTAVPLSYAMLLVIASTYPFPRYAAAVAGAELISLLLRLSDRSSGWRVPIMVERLVVAAATIAVYDGFRTLTNHDETVAAVLISLGAAALAQVPVDLLARWALRLRPTFSPRARLAWLAIGSSGMLMAIGYRGVDGMGQVGIWGPLLFSTPLLAAWYASSLGVSAHDMSDLEMAALLHHLGQVTIDEPEDPTRTVPPSEVAAVTSAMLREIKPLAGAGDIVAGDAAEPRRRVAVQVLRIASDYDDLTSRDNIESGVAIETLRSAPGYVYDEKVLAALERVVSSGSFASVA